MAEAVSPALSAPKSSIFNVFFSLKSLTKSLLFVLLALGITLQSCKKEEVSPLDSPKHIELNTNMRKLWSDHMHWTLATVDAFFNEPDQLDSKLARLLQNQKDIGNAIVPYYGQAAGDQLAQLLTEHILGAVPVLQAAQTGDQTALNTAVEDWYGNAKEIADFLSAANPENWPATATEPALEMHITHTIAYSVSILQGNYDEALTGFEEALHHMLMLADTLSQGIARQFPKKF